VVPIIRVRNQGNRFATGGATGVGNEKGGGHRCYCEAWEEIMEVVHNHEAQVGAAFLQREELIKKDLGGRCMDSVGPCTGERVEGGRDEVERKLLESAKKVQQQSAASHDNSERFVKLSYSSFRLYSQVRNYPADRKEKSPLEEVKNLAEARTRTARVTPLHQQGRRNLEPRPISQRTLPCILSLRQKKKLPFGAPFKWIICPLQ
jgi:hypothetical protein